MPSDRHYQAYRTSYELLSENPKLEFLDAIMLALRLATGKNLEKLIETWPKIYHVFMHWRNTPGAFL